MKYEFTEEKIKFDGVVLHRIRAVKNFGDVKIGELGGFIEGEKNLSHDGDAWVYDEARVIENALVGDEARVYENALVFGEAWVFGGARVYGDARVGGKARVYGDARVSGEVWVGGDAQVHGDAVIC